ncbi:MAG: hypothetical protein V4819_19205 [Verrucomicrobiota bacterium]
MGLTGAGLNRFRNQVDATLADAFPVRLLMGEDRFPVTGSGPGGRAVTEYVDAGEKENFRFPFRIEKAAGVAVPFVGMPVVWKMDDDSEIPLEISEAPFRPHEAKWSFTCKKRRV